MPNVDISALIDARSERYGPPLPSMENLGVIWTGLIQQHYQIKLDHPIPGHLAALMMAALKISRASYAYHEDNFHDLASFSRFAQQAQASEDTTPANNGHENQAQRVALP